MCKKYSLDVLRDYVKNGVKPELKAKIEEHLKICKDCGEKAAKLQKLASAFGRIRDKQKIQAKQAFNSAVLNRFAKHKVRFLSKLFRLAYVPFVAAGTFIIAIFIYTNYFQDKYTQNLRVTLEMVKNFKNISEMKYSGPVFKFILANQVSKYSKDKISIMNLEFVGKVASLGKEDAQLKDVKAFLEDELYRKEKERGELLVVLDKTVYFISKNIFELKLAIADTPAGAGSDIMGKLITEEGKFKKEKDSLLKEIEKKDVSDKIKGYYRIGSMSMQYFDYEFAMDIFEKYKFVSQKDTASADFNIAWCNKQLGKYEEAREEFGLIADSENYKDLCKYQEANTYEKEGKHDIAAVKYKELSAETEDNITGSMAKFNEGYSYLYGLNDPVKAKEIFQELEQTYPDIGISRYVKEHMSKVVEAVLKLVNDQKLLH